jgi:hypothetical protein
MHEYEKDVPALLAETVAVALIRAEIPFAITPVEGEHLMSFGIRAIDRERFDHYTALATELHPAHMHEEVMHS